MNLPHNKKNIFVIIPSFNEGKVIRTTVLSLIAKGYTVVVIDDCSSDNTEEVLRTLEIIYLKHEIRLGQGAALQTGIEYALLKKAEYAVTFDADGQHNFEEIPSLLEPIVNQKADITIGTRFKRKEDIAEIPKLRKLILKIAILINGVLTGIWLTDAHNGFRALGKRALVKIKLKENKMAHATEILSQIKHANLRYEEVPVRIIYTDYSRMKGQNNINSVSILVHLLLRKLF